MSDVHVRHETERRRFVVDVDGREAALTYRRLGEDTLDLDHTYTPPAARGRGVASALVRAALDHARKEGLRVLPTCPYVASWLEHHPEYADLAE